MCYLGEVRREMYLAQNKSRDEFRIGILQKAWLDDTHGK
jgi:hypothetical protein